MNHKNIFRLLQIDVLQKGLEANDIKLLFKYSFALFYKNVYL